MKMWLEVRRNLTPYFPQEQWFSICAFSVHSHFIEQTTMDNTSDYPIVFHCFTEEETEALESKVK